jgi:endo-1,4-beta-D-glucanase Y
VTHSGYKQTADDVIKKLLAQTQGVEALLVSSDRELVDAARSHNIDSCDARAFYQLLQEKDGQPIWSEPSKKTNDIVRLSSDENDELARLMEEASRTVPNKSDDVSQLRKREGHVLSKQEKRLLRKVKKL